MSVSIFQSSIADYPFSDKSLLSLRSANNASVLEKRLYPLSCSDLSNYCESGSLGICASCTGHWLEKGIEWDIVQPSR